MPHQPLSRDLEELLHEQREDGGLTLNEVIERTAGRGLYLLMILFCLPFFTPVPLPGLSNVLGVVMLIMGVRLACGLPPRLPRFIGERKFRPRRMERVLKASVRIVRFIEKLVRPRGSRWLRWRIVFALNGSLIAFMALMLALPLPPLIPFTNAFPCYAIVFLAAGMMEDDGVAVWLGYTAVVGTVLYFIFLAGGIIVLFERYFDRVVSWLQSVL